MTLCISLILIQILINTNINILVLININTGAFVNEFIRLFVSLGPVGVTGP